MMKEVRRVLFTGIGYGGILFLLILACACFTGCGTEDDDDNSGGGPFDSTQELHSGIFIDSPVSGLTYQSKILSGVTEADGTFMYLDDDTLSFYVGGLYIGSANGSESLSPIDLVQGAFDGTDQRVNNICVLLQTLDQDGDLNNGIQITSDIANIVTNYADLVDFDQTTADFAADSNVIDLLADLNAANVFADLDPRSRKLRSASEARDHLARTLSERKIVNTQYGQIRGYDPAANTVYGAGEGMWQFIGIAYAKPPVGDLRWMPPQPLAPWTGVRDAVAWRDQSPQNPDMERYGHGGMSEDCLYLNITTPKDADNLPVMVWFHGGGFRHFSGNQWDFNNASGLPTKGVVLVTVTHRLGSIGYLAHPLLSAASGHDGSGNYGQLDLIAALEWVRDNIAGFGGDPGNVTIFGQSGGGAKVASLMISPLAKGLFHRAICQSGGVSSTPRETSLSTAEDLGAELFAALGVTTLEEARAKTWEEVVAAAEPIVASFAPNIDNHYMLASMEESIKGGLESDVPFMAGRTSGDLGGTGPDFAEQMSWRSDHNNADQFVYKWNKLASGWQDRGILSGHTCDLSYLFNFPLSHAYYYLFNYIIDPVTGEKPEIGDLNGNGRTWMQGDMADVMIDAGWNEVDNETADMARMIWTNFARTGDPSTDDFMWPVYTSENGTFVEIDATLTVKENLSAGW